MKVLCIHTNTKLQNLDRHRYIIELVVGVGEFDSVHRIYIHVFAIYVRVVQLAPANRCRDRQTIHSKQ